MARKLTLKAGAGTTHIELADALEFIGAEAIAVGEKRGEVTTRGPWSIMTGYRALAVTATWRPGPAGYDYVDTYTIHGMRALSAPRQSGYTLEGYCSIDGVKRSAFTSSILFEIPDGRLVSVAVIHVRTERGI